MHNVKKSHGIIRRVSCVDSSRFKSKVYIKEIQFLIERMGNRFIIQIPRAMLYLSLEGISLFLLKRLTFKSWNYMLYQTPVSGVLSCYSCQWIT